MKNYKRDKRGRETVNRDQLKD